MKSLRKILIILIIIVISGLTVLPVMKDFAKVININGNILFSFLDVITDSIIVNASNGDYNYSGNLYLWYKDENNYNQYLEYRKGIYIYTESAGLPLEYSVNGREFKDCEYLMYGSDILNLDKDINTVVLRHKPTGDILLKAVAAKYKDTYIIVSNAKVGWEVGSNIFMPKNSNYLNLEYSLDNGQTFNSIGNNYCIDVQIPEVFGDSPIIVREKNNPQKILYKSPEIKESDIEQNYTYENGKTTVKFKLKDDEENLAEYSFIINGEEKLGNEFEVENDTNVRLKVKRSKEFIENSKEKEIEVKVVKVEKPTIEKTDDDLVKITSGEIENDEFFKIYYSIDGGPNRLYRKELKLPKGNHTIKAYQLSKNKKVISEETELEVTITKDFDAIEEDDDEEIDSDILEIINRKRITKVSKNNNVEKEAINTNSNTDLNSNTNNDENLNANTEENKIVNYQEKTKATNSPKTSDNIFIFVVIIISIVTLNVIITKKNKNK